MAALSAVHCFSLSLLLVIVAFNVHGYEVSFHGCVDDVFDLTFVTSLDSALFGRSASCF
jgi:hypothetical protein